jgi:hypothetical protein
MMHPYENLEYMSLTRQFFWRYWSLVVAFLVVALEAATCGIDVEEIVFQDPVKAVWIICTVYIAATVLCVGLIVHSWQIQRRYARDVARRVLWAHILLFPAISTLVIGLEQIQVFTYDLDIEHGQFQYLHWYMLEVRDYLIWAVPLDVVLIVLWAVVAALKNKSGRSMPGPT